MKTDEIRALSTDEIKARLVDAHESIFKFRFQDATGQLTDTSRIRMQRREIARLETIIRERELVTELEESEV